MYLKNGYWRPDNGETIKIKEIPHVVKISKVIEDNKIVTKNYIPRNPLREFGFEEGCDVVVKGNISRQDIHYEWIEIEFKENDNFDKLEIPLRYFEQHPDIQYENTAK